MAQRQTAARRRQFISYGHQRGGVRAGLSDNVDRPCGPQPRAVCVRARAKIQSPGPSVTPGHHLRDVRLGGAIVLLCLLALSLTLVSREPWPIGLLFVSGMLLLIPFLVAFSTGKFDPFEPIYLWAALYGYMYVFKPFGRIASGWGFNYGGASLEKALVISIFGLLVFYIGYYSVGGSQLARHLPVMRGYMAARKLRRCGWFFIMLGAAGLWEYMSISGGWQVFWSKPHGFGGRADLTTAYVYQLP